MSVHNEGEYLELVNDLKVQYDDMKTQYEKKISFLEEENEELKIDLQWKSSLVFVTNIFTSSRPSARKATYVNY
jgi:hypothetical protein